MKIEAMNLHPFQMSLITGQQRNGIWVELVDIKGNRSWGEVSPLPGLSKETMDDAFNQLKEVEKHILFIDWKMDRCFEELELLALFPSVSFGLESALLSLLSPLHTHAISASALLMGSSDQILEQAKERLAEGFTSAKLKVSLLSFEEAFSLIHQLKDKFYLRIDVNRAWDTSDSLEFFSQFPKETFDYVEEPFKEPKDLHLFQHPLAVDESFPCQISLEQLEKLPTLKALIYKPTIQGGLVHCFSLHKWACENEISLVLSSCFESLVGLLSISSMASRMSIRTPVGIGTYHFLTESGKLAPWFDF